MAFETSYPAIKCKCIMHHASSLALGDKEGYDFDLSCLLLHNFKTNPATSKMSRLSNGHILFNVSLPLQRAMMQNVLYLFVSFYSPLIWRYFLDVHFNFSWAKKVRVRSPKQE